MGPLKTVTHRPAIGHETPECARHLMASIDRGPDRAKPVDVALRHFLFEGLDQVKQLPGAVQNLLVVPAES